MPQSPTITKHLWLRRVGWLVLIWGLSVAALGLVAWLFRVFMGFAGLTL